jgi:hypothetical protein
MLAIYLNADLVKEDNTSAVYLGGAREAEGIIGGDA